MIDPIGNVLESIVASSSGNSVTAIELFESCLMRALARPGYQYNCVTKVKDLCAIGKTTCRSAVQLDGASSSREIMVSTLGTLQPFDYSNAFQDGVFQQALGYLPPNLIAALQKRRHQYLLSYDC